MTKHLLIGLDDAGIPIIAENGDPALHPDAVREATEAEYEAYLDYWTTECKHCGVERGDHGSGWDDDCEHGVGRDTSGRTPEDWAHHAE